MTTTSRIAVWDLLKLLAIFLVVWGHCMQYLLPATIEDNPLFLWICSFHMPLFMVLSGLFAEKSFARTWQDYFIRRSIQLLIPWISWTTIIILMIFLLDSNFNEIKNFIINSLWFLKSLFICGLLALIGFKIKGNRIFWIVASFVISQLFLVWEVFKMYPCFLFGILCARTMKHITKWSKPIALITGLFFIALSVLAAHSSSFWMRNLGIRELLFNGGLSITNNLDFLIALITKRYAQVLLGCIGALFFISLFILLFRENQNKYIPRLSIFGQYTLGVYVIQTLIVETVLPHFLSIDIEYAFLFNYLIAPALSFTIVGTCLYINLFIENKSKYVTLFLFGKRK